MTKRLVLFYLNDFFLLITYFFFTLWLEIEQWSFFFNCYMHIFEKNGYQKLQIICPVYGEWCFTNNSWITSNLGLFFQCCNAPTMQYEFFITANLAAVTHLLLMGFFQNFVAVTRHCSPIEFQYFQRYYVHPTRSFSENRWVDSGVVNFDTLFLRGIYNKLSIYTTSKFCTLLLFHQKTKIRKNYAVHHCRCRSCSV